MTFEKQAFAHGRTFAVAAALPVGTLNVIRASVDQALRAGLDMPGYRQLLARQGVAPLPLPE